MHRYLRLEGVIISEPDLADTFLSGDCLICYPRRRCEYSGINSDFGLPSLIRDCVVLTGHLLSARDRPQCSEWTDLYQYVVSVYSLSEQFHLQSLTPLPLSQINLKEPITASPRQQNLSATKL